MTQMSEDTRLRRRFPQALTVRNLTGTNQEFLSYLALHESDSLDGYSFCIMGDLRNCFGIDDTFKENEDGLFGHYIVQDKIVRELDHVNPALKRRVYFESEGGTFFVYTKDRPDAIDLLDFIEKFSHPSYDPC